MRDSSERRRRKPVRQEPFEGRRRALSSLRYDLRFAAGVLGDTVRLR
jgi:hypothetical protein